LGNLDQSKELSYHQQSEHPSSFPSTPPIKKRSPLPPSCNGKEPFVMRSLNKEKCKSLAMQELINNDCIINIISFPRWYWWIFSKEGFGLHAMAQLLSHPNLPSNPNRWTTYMCSHQPIREQQGDSKCGVIFTEISSKFRKIAKILILLQMDKSLAIQLIMIF
jgi:hypothetical protein